MNIAIETLLSAAPRDLLAWGVSAAGRPVLAIECGSHRVLLELAAHEAEQLGMGAIYIAKHLEISAAERRGSDVAGGLVDGAGVPIAPGRRS